MSVRARGGLHVISTIATLVHHDVIVGVQEVKYGGLNRLDRKIARSMNQE